MQALLALFDPEEARQHSLARGTPVATDTTNP
jgi:hypothetical protein